ncbi:hypothetical protein apy_00120 [Aeropyrum pernix]|uniref:Tyr recombinase domain-containing protein n=1 Tax=Aeropyrum pernix TaxID=56636 RepID=A0A401H770_AERPX|nr:hypothetical protein apy_00120 [Aeropyrum pernix]
MLPEPQTIPQEARRQLLNLLAEKGRVKPRDLGVSRAYFYQMRHGLRPVPDQVLERLLEKATDDDLARIPYFAQYLDYTRIKRLDAERIVKVFLEWAKANPATAKAAYETIGVELERLGLTGRVVIVSEAHLAEWTAYLEARVSEGSLHRETAREYDRYLRRALEDLGYKLGPHLVRAHLRRVALEHPKVAHWESVALRLFIREVLQDRELYSSIPSIRPKSSKTRAPAWGEVCRVIEAVEHPASRAFLLLAASTGMRVEALRELKLDQLRLEERLIWVWLDRRTKRDYFSFFPEHVKDYLENVYLPWREIYLERLGRESDKLFPLKRVNLYRPIYEAMDRVGVRFEIRSIRHRVTEHLSHFLSSFEVNALTGHAPRDIVERHYLQHDAREDLRRKYDEAMAKVPCLGGRSVFELEG